MKHYISRRDFLKGTATAATLTIVTLLEALGFMPYSVSLVILFFVSIIGFFGSKMGGFLFLDLYCVVNKRLGLKWWDVMDDWSIDQPIAGVFGAWLVTAGTLVVTTVTAVAFIGAPARAALGIIGLIWIIVGGVLM